MRVILILLLVIVFGAEENARADSNIGGSFTLTDQDGKQVSDSDFRGKFMLVFFGFTHCPDLCPTTLLHISQTLKQLKADKAKIAPLFITVDPERDTPADMKLYLKNFDAAITGLTGTREQIDKVQAEYKTYSLKVEDKDTSGGYGFDHSAYIYLMDPQGKFLTVFTVDSSPSSVAGKIRKYLTAKPPGQVD